MKVARDKIRCKEVYAQGAYRYRNPDEDLPTDFAAKQKEYFADLNLPLSADEFIATQQQEMKEALEMFDKGIPKNKKVEFTQKMERHGLRLLRLIPSLNRKTWLA